MNKDGSLFGVAVFTLGYVAVTYAAGKLFSKALARASSSSNTDEDDMRFRLDKRPSSPRGPSSKKRKSKVASQLEEAEEDEEEDVDVSLLHEHWAGDIPPELEEVIDILKYPEIYAQMGSSMPKGCVKRCVCLVVAKRLSLMNPRYSLLIVSYYTETRARVRRILPRCWRK